MVVRVIVVNLQGERITIDVCNTEEELKTITVLQLKEKIRRHEGIPPDQMRLIFVGKELEEDSLLSEYGITQDSTIHMVLRLSGGGSGDAMGDKVGETRSSMERLANFEKCNLQ